MKYIQEEKDSYIKRIEKVIKSLKSVDNAFDIEGYINMIQVISKRAHEEIHAINSDVK